MSSELARDLAVVNAYPKGSERWWKNLGAFVCKHQLDMAGITEHFGVTADDIRAWAARHKAAGNCSCCQPEATQS